MKQTQAVAFEYQQSLRQGPANRLATGQTTIIKGQITKTNLRCLFRAC